MQAPACQAPGEFFLCSVILAPYPIRPGALIAGTWAAMQYMGSEYVSLGQSHNS
jgi:hypothetical protein